MIKQLITCESCEAEFSVKHNLDEEYYEIAYCIFCGENIEEDSIIDYEEAK
jgi:hypothetical protein